MNEKLTEDARQAALSELTGWDEVDGRDAIRKEFKFKNFIEAWGWMSQMAIIA